MKPECKSAKSPSCMACESRTESVFDSLPDPALKILNESKITSQFKRGQFVFYADNFPSGLYCVNAGVVRLETSGPNGNGHILRMIGTGGILGYRSLFADEPYHASAIVHEDAVICLIPKAAIFKLVREYPNLSLKLLSKVSTELRESENRWIGLTDKNAGERIAEAVLFLREQFPNQNWTRKEIAEWAGTTPETVMRTLAEFESQGLVEQHGRKILLTNKKALIQKANLVF